MLTRLLTLLLLVALCVPPAGAAHVHLCLDGTGPLVSMHIQVADSGGQQLHVDTAGHHDHSVDIDSPKFSKVWPPSVDAGLVAFVPVLPVSLIEMGPVSIRSDDLPPLSPPFLIPPLRGPPA